MDELNLNSLLLLYSILFSYRECLEFQVKITFQFKVAVIPDFSHSTNLSLTQIMVETLFRKLYNCWVPGNSKDNYLFLINDHWLYTTKHSYKTDRWWKHIIIAHCAGNMTFMNPMHSTKSFLLDIYRKENAYSRIGFTDRAHAHSYFRIKDYFPKAICYWCCCVSFSHTMISRRLGCKGQTGTDFFDFPIMFSKVGKNSTSFWKSLVASREN